MERQKFFVLQMKWNIQNRVGQIGTGGTDYQCVEGQLEFGMVYDTVDFIPVYVAGNVENSIISIFSQAAYTVESHAFGV